MELILSVWNTRKYNQIEKYFNWENNIKTIKRMGPYGNVALHVASSYGYNEIIQLFLTNSALKSLENISSPSALYDESKMDEIKKLFLENFNFHGSQEEIPDIDYIEWSLSGSDLIKKAKEFREQINLYRTYDNQHHLITKLLIEIIEYYLKEYLVQQENFTENDTKNIENYFKKAIEEQNYFKYFIKAYTLANNFHHVLNKHLALYILHYFDPPSYSFLRTKYRLINCLVHIVTLLINHPDIHKHKYNGVTYRGLLMNKNDLKCYSIGNHILNRSFVSTSKNRSIAQLFADNTHLGGTPDHNDLTQVPVLLKYTITQDQAAIDIEHISMVPDEEEVLLLPFSVFKIKDRIENSSNMCSSVLVEIDLEECEDNAQINNEKQKNKSLTSLQHQTKKRKIIISIGLIIVLSLIVIAVFIIKIVAENIRKREQLNTKNININQNWIQNGITVAGENGYGNRSNQFSFPRGVYINDDQTIYVSDWGNDRIVKWENGSTSGQIVAGGNGNGNRTNQLKYPANVIIYKENDSLIICDTQNHRIVRWPRQNGQSGETILSDITCYDLIMDNDGYLYVADAERCEVRRWKIGDQNATIVAGGNRAGMRLDQLSGPEYIFIDQDHSIYVSDFDNHRVMKWMKGAKEGIVVAGGQGKGNGLNQLSYPGGIIIDQLGTLYIADSNNHRVMGWLKGATQGSVIVGGNGEGEQSNQFSWPIDLSFGRQNNLYVVDHQNHRIQKFNNKNSEF